MSSIEERLRERGIRLVDGERPDVRAELGRIAGLLRQRGCRWIGLVPASDEVGVPAVALHLAVALADAAGGPTGVVDALGTWLEEATASPQDAEASGASLRWVTDRVAIIVARSSAPAGSLRGLEAILRHGSHAMKHIVVDLTGLDHAGEHLDAMAMLDGVAVVARSGHTTDRQLQRWASEIPTDRNLGVLLVTA